MKQKYGDVSLKEDESDDSSSESEDDQAEVWRYFIFYPGEFDSCLVSSSYVHSYVKAEGFWKITIEKK